MILLLNALFVYVRIVVASPGRIEAYSHLEANFSYATPLFHPTPDVYSSPDKKTRVENKPAWKRFRWNCSIGCDECGSSSTVRNPLQDLQTNTVRKGATTDKQLVLKDAESSCNAKCTFKCASVFSLASRLKIRKNEHFSTGGVLLYCCLLSFLCRCNHFCLALQVVTSS